MGTPVDQFIDTIKNGGPDVIVLLLVALVLGSMGKWYFGRVYDDLRSERDTWKAIAIQAVENAEKLTDTMESAKRGR